ncbi:MAG: DegT/DnrJ/EryC1/StrS family aminotransferase [Chlamydiota bacterium]|jgi:dTDP-4-amino-4,6-dideoxygalactose transaminase
MESNEITYPWPIITEEIEEAVVQQLHTTLGTYDRSGITKEFEDKFKEIHKSKFALVTSSGTAALHSAFYALDLGPGDEVICTDYTFFATAMPLFQLGVVPVLADCDPNGGLAATEIDRLITKKTTAVVLTHMWGNPCEMDAILDRCQKYSLRLVEDCSHAHGATYKGQHVGTFGDIGIWSLQSQKIIAAGEAGILVTNDRACYDKAQLLGHFNKRALQEMDPSSPLYQYAITGTGLKYRPAALGLAIANKQLDYLEQWINAKNRNAERIQSIIGEVDGIKFLKGAGDFSLSAYYAFTFTIDPKIAPFSREELVSCMHSFGFKDIDIPNSTSCLHRYPIFQKPISPVYSYQNDICIRGDYPNSKFISDHLVKISVPIDDYKGSKGRFFVDSFETIWKKAKEKLCALIQKN